MSSHCNWFSLEPQISHRSRGLDLFFESERPDVPDKAVQTGRRSAPFIKVFAAVNRLGLTISRTLVVMAVQERRLIRRHSAR